MMLYNLIKYLVQTRLRLWDIKITIFKKENSPNDLLKIYYFYISQIKSCLDKIFYKLVYHHIIYICDFLNKFRWFFYHNLHEFLRRLRFSFSFKNTRFVPAGFAFFWGLELTCGGAPGWADPLASRPRLLAAPGWAPLTLVQARRRGAAHRRSAPPPRSSPPRRHPLLVQNWCLSCD